MTLPTWTREHSVEAFLLLPGAHVVGHTFVEIGRPDGHLYAPEPHPRWPPAPAGLK